MEYVPGLIVIASVLALYWLYEVEWKRYRLDKFRDDLFVIRDELFVAASSGKLRFNDDAYVILRTNLNGMIRFSHELSFFRFVLMQKEMKTTVGKQVAKTYQARMASSIDELSAEQRLIIMDIQRRVHERVFLYIGFNSIFGCVFFGLAGLFVALKVLFSAGLDALKDGEDKKALVNEISEIKSVRKRIEAFDVEANLAGCVA